MRNPHFPSPRSEVERLFDELIHTAWGGRDVGPCWTPRADVFQESDRYILEMDLPGVLTADLSITARRGLLRIEGTRERVRRSASEQHHVVECSCGRFVRTFRLPDDAEADEVRARLREGILTVEIPRTREREEGKP